MNELLIIKMKEAIRSTEETGIYEHLYHYAYSDNFIIRFLFMKMLLSLDNKLDISELYGDNITEFFKRYDNNGNVISIMSLTLIRALGDIVIVKNPTIYKQIITFIVDNYIKSDEIVTYRN